MGDSDGRRWFVKRAAKRSEWRAEVRAYEHWLPSLASSTPSLLAADAHLAALVVSALPGEVPRTADAGVHRRAGALLRSLHGARPRREQRDVEKARTSRRLDAVLSRNPDVVSRAEADYARSAALALQERPVCETVPCHGDYFLHNWLVDDTGSLRMVDFGDSRWDRVALDFVQLTFLAWWTRPGLAAAFVQGYGRGLTAGEVEFLRLRLPTNAVAQIAVGHRLRDPDAIDLGRSRLQDLMHGRPVPGLDELATVSGQTPRSG